MDEPVEIPDVKTKREELGYVSAPSGKIIFIDGGLLRFWQHDREPVIPPHAADEETRKTLNDSVDLAIEGPEAQIAGKAFDRQWNPKFLFDIPREGVAKIVEAFDKIVKEKNLIARAVVLPKRITHRQRVDLALEFGHNAGEIQYHGMYASVIGRLAPQKAYRVIGQRMTNDADKSRWRQVLVEIEPGTTPVRSELVGYIAVDEARILIADVDALGAWKDDEPLDGLADLVFWGKDARKLAEQIAAPQISEREFGWIDLRSEEALQLGQLVDREKARGKLKLAMDFRPHSHSYLAMDQVRKSETESGIVNVGGATLCMLATTWGDGVFPVYRDFDEGGNVARLRIDLGNSRIVQRQRKFEELWFGEFARTAFVSKRITADQEPVRWLYREKPDNPDDSGWRCYAGDEDDAYCNDAQNVAMVPLRELIQRDRALEEIFRSPIGSAFERAEAHDAFKRVENWEPPEEE